MRTVLMATALLLGLVGGCTMEDSHRPYFHDDSKDLPEFSAARLGQPFDDASISEVLSPEEREALSMSEFADMFAPPENDGGERPAPRGQSTGDKIAGASMSLIGVGITLGAMAAPYLLF